jgi:hypothetical protein
MTIKMLFGLVILLLSFNSAWAYPVSGDPVLMEPQYAGAPDRTATPYGVTNNTVTLQNTTTYTNSPMSYSATGAGTSQVSNADPLGFQVNTQLSAWSGSSLASVDAVGVWFVLNGGTPGAAVSLVADIGFQAQISALGSTGTASFTNYLSFVSSTSSTERQYLIVQNGVVNPQGSSNQDLAGTVDDFYRATPGTYDLNEVIRSEAFEVLVGTPFRLGLVINTTIASGDGSASIDFDPGFAGLYFLNNEGELSGLREGGYTMTAIPIPPTFLLLGSGLAALVGFRKKFQRS